MLKNLSIRDYCSSYKYLSLRRKYGRWSAEIHPDAVIYPYSAKEWPKYIKRWPLFACPGDWDLVQHRKEPFRLRQLKELFVDQLPYQKSASYTEMLGQLKQFGVTQAPKLRSQKEIDEYFAGVYSLYESMQKNGYQRRPDLDRSSKGGKEITIRIGRHGELMKAGEGTHRLALARLLEVKSVFAVVDVVHPQWIEKIQKKYGGSVSYAIQQALSFLTDTNKDQESI